MSLVGLGYESLPIAEAFSKKMDVTGFDLNAEKVAFYQQGKDPTCWACNQGVADCAVAFTSEPDDLRDALFHIVAMPTP